MTKILRSLAAAFVGLCLAASVAAGEPNAPIDKTVWAWVTTDGSGAVTAVDADPHQHDVAVDVVRTLAARLRFAPATKDGVAAPGGFPLEVGVRFTPDAAGDYAASLRWAKVHAVHYTPTPARYPSRELRGGIGGWATLQVVATGHGAIDPESVAVLDQGAFRNGRVVKDRITATTFAKATRDVVGAWSFRTAVVDGAPLAVRVSVPMMFRPWNSDSETTEFPEAAGAARRPVPDPELAATGIVLPRLLTTMPEDPPAGAHPVEITGSRVSRTAVTP